MWRILSLPFLFMLTASRGLPDPIKAGDTLGALKGDPSAQALFALIFVSVGLLVFSTILIAALVKSQSAVAVVAERFQSAASKLADATTTQDMQHAVQLALLQQGQSDQKALLAEILSAVRRRGA